MGTGFNRRDKGKVVASLTYVVSKSVIPLAGGGQAGSTPLASGNLFTISSTGSSGDSLQVPTANPGLELTVINNCSNPYWVYGSSNSSDTINGVAAATGVRLAAHSMTFFAPSSQGNWVTEGLGSGYNGQYPTLDSQDSLTAVSSSLAVTVPAVLSHFTTVATSGFAARLPATASGLQITVGNGASSNPMVLFANSSNDTFATLAGSVAGNTGQVIAAGKVVTYTSFGAGVWHGNPSS